mmetsp:Transcript_13607/g.37455  ORF Transcript_13607/g.37455 Transcript_13607/m.37455 type:complete len:254 (-) Transcript_13607:50-811(-)
MSSSGSQHRGWFNHHTCSSHKAHCYNSSSCSSISSSSRHSSWCIAHRRLISLCHSSRWDPTKEFSLQIGWRGWHPAPSLQPLRKLRCWRSIRPRPIMSPPYRCMPRVPRLRRHLRHSACGSCDSRRKASVRQGQVSGFRWMGRCLNEPPDRIGRRTSLDPRGTKMNLAIGLWTRPLKCCQTRTGQRECHLQAFLTWFWIARRKTSRSSGRKRGTRTGEQGTGTRCSRVQMMRTCKLKAQKVTSTAPMLVMQLR